MSGIRMTCRRIGRRPWTLASRRAGDALCARSARREARGVMRGAARCAGCSDGLSARVGLRDARGVATDCRLERGCAMGGARAQAYGPPTVGVLRRAPCRACTLARAVRTARGRPPSSPPLGVLRGGAGGGDGNWGKVAIGAGPWPAGCWTGSAAAGVSASPGVIVWRLRGGAGVIVWFGSAARGSARPSVIVWLGSARGGWCEAGRDRWPGAAAGGGAGAGVIVWFGSAARGRVRGRLVRCCRGVRRGSGGRVRRGGRRR